MVVVPKFSPGRPKFTDRKIKEVRKYKKKQLIEQEL